MAKVPNKFFEYARQVSLEYPEECQTLTLEVYKRLLATMNLDLSKNITIQIANMKRQIDSNSNSFKQTLVQIHDNFLRERLYPSKLTSTKGLDENNDIIQFSLKVFIDNKKIDKSLYLSLFKVYEASLNSNQGVAEIISRANFQTLLNHILMSYLKNSLLEKFPESEANISEIISYLQEQPNGDSIRPYGNWEKLSVEKNCILQYYNFIHTKLLKPGQGKLWVRDSSASNTGFSGFTYFNNFITGDPSGFDIKLNLLIKLRQFVQNYKASPELNLAELYKYKLEGSDDEQTQQEFWRLLKTEKDIQVAFKNLQKKLKSVENYCSINAKDILMDLVRYDIVSPQSAQSLKQVQIISQKYQQQQNQSVMSQPPFSQQPGMIRKMDVGQIAENNKVPKSEVDAIYENFKDLIAKRMTADNYTIFILANSKKIKLMKNERDELTFQTSLSSKIFRNFKEALNDCYPAVTNG